MSRFAGVLARTVVKPTQDIECLRGQMGESTWQVDKVFERAKGERNNTD